nr:hypothetical protein BaRGS_012288 [Batillaria attramentaria]
MGSQTGTSYAYRQLKSLILLKVTWSFDDPRQAGRRRELVTGNEEADRLAKSGSRKEQPQQAVSYTEAKTLVRNRHRKTAIGIRGKDGVVLGVEKLVTSKLYEQGANKRIFNMDRHIGGAVAGLLADARQLVERAKEECSNYRYNYGSSIPLKHLTDRVSMYVHAHTLHSAVRPFGTSMIVASYGVSGPEMYLIEPSGVSWGYYGCAIGKAKQSAKTEIEKLKMKDMTMQDLVKEVAKM